MGYMADKREAKQTRSRRKRVFAFGTKKGTMTFGSWPDLLRLIEIVTESGDGISLGKTLDGGACVVTILNGTPPFAKAYAADVEEAGFVTEKILEAYDDDEKARGAFE